MVLVLWLANPVGFAVGILVSDFVWDLVREGADTAVRFELGEDVGD
jgi:hypothetical protein